MNMVCSRCQKRMAVLFLAHLENGEMHNKGLCLKCARELNIPQVREVMDKMGLSEEDIEQMTEQMNELMGGDLSDFETDFEMGGAQSLPILQSIFGDKEKTPEPIQQPVRDETPPKQPPPKKENKRKRKYLDNFCENLTERAAQGKIDRVVGREREIYRVIQILNRRTKNNPCLIDRKSVV